MCRNKDKHQWPGQNKNEYRNNKAKNKGNPNGDPDSFADTFVFSSSEILSDKSREGISEILNRHISKRIDFNCRSKASHNSRSKAIDQSLHHQYTEIHDRLLGTSQRRIGCNFFDRSPL